MAVLALRKMKLRTRLLAFFLALSLAPVLFIGVYAYQVYTGSINRHLAASAEQSVKLLHIALQSELEQCISYINTLSVASEVQGMLTEPAPRNEPRFGQAAQSAKKMVQGMPFPSRYMKSIRIVDRNDQVIYDLGYDDIPAQRFSSLLRQLDAMSPRDALQYVRTLRGVDVIMLGRKIFRFAGSGEHIGYILVYIDETLLSNDIFGNISFGSGSNILLMDSSGTVFSSKDRALLNTSLTGKEGLHGKIVAAAAQGETSFNTIIGGSRSLVIFSYNPDFDTYFVATIPQSYISSGTARITANLALLAALVILLCLAALFFLFRSIMTPIRRMVGFCSAAADDLESRLIDPSPDELGFLARTIDRYVHEIKELAQKSKADERRKRELELERLQYQINPHFLFNTLNTFRWVAALGGVPVVSEGISSLSKLLQSTLMRKDEFIPLGDELENLRHYLTIQRIRYADRFEVSYDIDESLLEKKTPRLILQPLAENAILHGAREGGQSIRLLIACGRTSAGDIALRVEDDGQGFDMEKQNESKNGRFSGIGLPNVQERLRLYFGEGYGLTVESRPGEGTRCLILMPGGEGGGGDV